MAHPDYIVTHRSDDGRFYRVWEWNDDDRVYYARRMMYQDIVYLAVDPHRTIWTGEVSRDSSSRGLAIQPSSELQVVTQTRGGGPSIEALPGM